MSETFPALPDLSSCAQEPIHIPGAIQPHGVLLALREGTLEVLQASANTADLLGRPPASLLGAPLEQSLGAEASSRVREAFADRDPSRLNPLAVRMETPSGPAAFDAILHRSDGVLVLELEPSAGPAGDFQEFFRLVQTSEARLRVSGDVGLLCQAAAEEVRRITGFDRVMVYRFDPDWNGEVVAEAREPDVDSFLGLRYPASDIPEQARRLYTVNPLRLIVSSDYQPAVLVPALNPVTGAPLDLSASVLRSVSPVHLEYLRNMAVGASMSVSLMRGDLLWGLIACHHREPRRVPFGVRSACEFLGRVVSLHLGLKEEFRDFEERARLRLKLDRILYRIQGSTSVGESLSQETAALVDLAGAGGLAIAFDGELSLTGETPSPSAVESLLDWLPPPSETPLVAVESLSDVLPQAAEYRESASGLLSIAVSGANRVVWFRPEVPRTVNWAGDPRKPVEIGPGGPRIHPRKSFELWKEEVRGRAEPWSPALVQVVGELRSVLVDLSLRQAEAEAKRELERLNRALERSNQELDSFAYIASHDLKEPLRGICNYSLFLLEDYGTALDPEGKAKLETLVRLGRRMEELIDSLLHFSRVTALDMSVGRTDLNEVLQRALELLQVRLRADRVDVRIPRPLPVMCADRVRIREVFHNLISNAVKYNDSPARWVEIGYLDEFVEGEPVTFYVRDNGIGVPERHRESIFQIFRRLHAREKYGGGTGAGLAIVKRIVQRHGGRVWVESAPGEGSTFYFTLPDLAEGAPLPAEANIDGE